MEQEYKLIFAVIAFILFLLFVGILVANNTDSFDANTYYDIIPHSKAPGYFRR